MLAARSEVPTEVFVGVISPGFVVHRKCASGEAVVDGQYDGPKKRRYEVSHFSNHHHFHGVKSDY